MSHFEYILTGELNDAFEEKPNFYLQKLMKDVPHIIYRSIRMKKLMRKQKKGLL